MCRPSDDDDNVGVGVGVGVGSLSKNPSHTAAKVAKLFVGPERRKIGLLKFSSLFKRAASDKGAH